MRSFAVAPILALAACSGGDKGSGGATSVDVNAAAARAEGDIANYAARIRPTPAPASAAPEPPAAPSAGAASEAPFEAGSAQGAGDVVQRYYALIEAGRYAEAWALWDDGGASSGMSAATFAASFAKYADYHAEIGAPGDVDAGAGQRHVTIPVRIYGMLKDHARPFTLAGTLELHRVAEGIEVPDPAKHEWRIATADIKPRPGDTASTPSSSMSSRLPAAPEQSD